MFAPRKKSALIGVKITVTPKMKILILKIGQQNSAERKRKKLNRKKDLMTDMLKICMSSQQHPNQLTLKSKRIEMSRRCSRTD